MKIQIGTTYIISNNLNNRFIEKVSICNSDIEIIKTTTWRRGYFEITPANSNEINCLEEAVKENWDGQLTPEDVFETCAYIEADDGSTEYFIESGDFDLDSKLEEYNDDEELQDEFFSFEEYLTEKLDFSSGDAELTIYGPIAIKKS